jgi:hypothetical protein
VPIGDKQALPISMFSRLCRSQPTKWRLPTTGIGFSYPVLLLCSSTPGNAEVVVITIVRTHSRIHRLYVLMIVPFHRLVRRSPQQ